MSGGRSVLGLGGGWFEREHDAVAEVIFVFRHPLDFETIGRVAAVRESATLGAR